jgi:hypothetical protein
VTKITQTETETQVEKVFVHEDFKGHTPAPWILENGLIYALNEQGTNRFSARLDGGYTTQYRNFSERTTQEELDANTKLMHSAPLLLKDNAFLVSVLRDVLEVLNENESEEDLSYYHEVKAIKERVASIIEAKEGWYGAQ